MPPSLPPPATRRQRIAHGKAGGVTGLVHEHFARGIEVTLIRERPLVYDPTAMEPTIEFTSVPPLGSYFNLKGIARHVDPATARVAVYIRVDSGWWSKPYWSSPATELEAEGSFSVAIATGGRD